MRTRITWIIMGLIIMVVMATAVYAAPMTIIGLDYGEAVTLSCGGGFAEMKVYQGLNKSVVAVCPNK